MCGRVAKVIMVLFFFSSRRRHTRWTGDWSSDVCSSDLRLLYNVELSALIRMSSVTERSPPPDIYTELVVLDPITRSSMVALRSEERRVGKECRSRWSAYHEKKTQNMDTQLRV